MQVHVHYQGLKNTQWMDQFITERVHKLDRYLGQASSVQVNVRQNANKAYVTSLAIHNPYHDYAFTTEGSNLFESFSAAVSKAARAMGEHKRKIKDKIHKRYVSMKEVV